MKIFVVHNHYLEKGGEDAVVEDEIASLRNHGHEVYLYERANSEIKNMSMLKRAVFFIRDMRWSKQTYNDIKNIIEKNKPDIAHIHNVFFMMTPSLYFALKENNIPIVQTLHNYRFLCLNGLCFHNGKPCEKCKKNIFFSALINRCYRHSLPSTIWAMRALKAHHSYKVFNDKIDILIALSEFSRKKFIEGGLSPEKIIIKPNFAEKEEGLREVGDYALYIGRLIEYKGINVLLDAYKKLGGNYQLKIIGCGPLYKKIKKDLEDLPNIEVLGQIPLQETYKYLIKSAFLVFPSECFENMPKVILEAFSMGVPVLASKIGAMQEMVQNNDNGLFFRVGDSSDLASKIRYLFENKTLLLKMGENAKKKFERDFSLEKNYTQLMEIYNSVLQKKGGFRSCLKICR